MKKRNLIASALAVGLAAVSVIGLAACDTPDDETKEIVFPEGAVMTADGIFETDIVDPWETEVRLTGDEGKRIEIVSGYLNGNSVGTTIVVKNHSDEGKVSPMPGIAERNDTYEWQPQGMPYFEWLEKVRNAADRSAMAALKAEDHVSLVVYRDGHPVAYFVWKYVAEGFGATISGNYSYYDEQVVRIPVVARELPLVDGQYQEVDEAWVDARIAYYVGMHSEATDSNPA